MRNAPILTSSVTVREVTVEASDGFLLGATLFEPSQASEATLVLHGATAVRQRFYRDFAGYLADHAIRVITYDYRGIGKSAPHRLRGFRATMRDWAEKDAAGVMGWARQTFPREPLLIAGHSFGGQMIGLLDSLRNTSGALLIASQLAYYRRWPIGMRLPLGLLWHGVVPSVTQALGYFPGRFGLGGVDLPAGVAREWARWCTHPDYLAGYVQSAYERFERFERPTLLMSFADDTFAPPATVRHLVSALGRTPLRHRHIDPKQAGLASIGHMGFFRRTAAEALWPEAVDFLLAAARGTLRSAEPPARELSLTEEVALDLAYGRD